MIKIPFWISHIFPRIDLLYFQAMVTWFDPGIGGRDQEIESSSQTKARSKTGNQANHQASWNERDTWTCNYMFLMFQISVHFFNLKNLLFFLCVLLSLHWFNKVQFFWPFLFCHFLGSWRWKFRKKKEKKFKQDPPPVPKTQTQEVTPTIEKEDVPPPVVEEDWQLKNSI